MVDKLPVPPPSSAKLKAQDLELLREDARRFLTRDRPAQDALWTQLLRPRGAVLTDYRQLLRDWSLSEKDDPSALASFLGGEPAITAVATAMVAKAMLGDSPSQQMILERIEGRPGPRKLDDDDRSVARQQMVEGIEAVVRAMNTQPTTVKVIDVTPEEPPK